MRAWRLLRLRSADPRQHLITRPPRPVSTCLLARQDILPHSPERNMSKQIKYDRRRFLGCGSGFTDPCFQLTSIHCEF